MIGGPCSRCGLAYSPKTAYVPCFDEGDTFETWRARQSAEIQPLLQPPPEGAKPRDVFTDGRSGTVDGAKQAAVRTLQRLVPPSMRRDSPAADAAVADLSALIVAHIQDAMEARPWVADLHEFLVDLHEVMAEMHEVLTDRDRLAAKVEELEARKPHETLDHPDDDGDRARISENPPHSEE